jgi:hypothetical protein
VPRRRGDREKLEHRRQAHDDGEASVRASQKRTAACAAVRRALTTAKLVPL